MNTNTARANQIAREDDEDVRMLWGTQFFGYARAIATLAYTVLAFPVH